MTSLPILRGLLHTRSGPLGTELERSPGPSGIGQVPRRLVPEGLMRSACGFCGTGCVLEAHMKDGEAVNIAPRAEGHVNLGRACPKGWEALSVLEAPDRATRPLVRRQGRLRETSWDDAARTFTTEMKAILDKHGPESVAFLSTGQIPMEEMAFLGAFAKFGMGLVHGDGNTRQCMATAVVAHKRSLGFDSPPFTYADFELAKVMVFVGANPCLAHPILWERVLKNPHDPTVVVIDPRRTETAMAATEHLPVAPKGDLALLYLVARRLLELEAVDRDFVAAHTEGFDAFVSFLAELDEQDLLTRTGLPRERIDGLAETIATGERVAFFWTMGVNQSFEGVRVAQAIINICLMTGNIGRPGTGPCSLTGQANAMGSRIFSNTTNLLGGRDFQNPDHRAHVAAELGIPVGRIPAQPSDAYDQILESVLSGRTKALWYIATNPAHSWISQPDFRDVLGRLDLLVVQDMYTTTETAELADIVLPAAGWGEKEGTFINSERRIQRIRKLRKAPGEALADFHIFQLLAEYWGVGDLFREWSSPEAVFDILRRLSGGQPCDFTGIDGYRQLEEAGGIQWPLRPGEKLESHERRLFEDGRFFRPNGRALFEFEAPRKLPEAPCSRYPTTLLTGRGSTSQWHTQTRSSKSEVLRALAPEEAYVEINVTDAKALRVVSGDSVIVRSRRGRVRVKAVVTPAVAPGQVFMPMHYPETNQLTLASFDPYSREPSYKACAVHLESAAGHPREARRPGSRHDRRI